MEEEKKIISTKTVVASVGKKTRRVVKTKTAVKGAKPSSVGKKAVGRPRIKKVDEVKIEKAVKEKGGVKPLNYLYGLGRRKEAVARVRVLKNGKGVITVNDKPCLEYFTQYVLQELVRAPLVAVGKMDKVDVVISVKGGGMRGQAEAVRLGIARALLKEDQTFRATLKPLGFLRRDPRIKERKKPGLKKARRAPQWAKR